MYVDINLCATCWILAISTWYEDRRYLGCLLVIDPAHTLDILCHLRQHLTCVSTSGMRVSLEICNTQKALRRLLHQQAEQRPPTCCMPCRRCRCLHPTDQRARHAWVSAAESVSQPWRPTSPGFPGIMQDVHGRVLLSQYLSPGAPHPWASLALCKTCMGECC